MTTTAPPEPRQGTAMDPRIRQRRIAVRRDEGRRRLRLLIAGSSIVAVVGTGIGITRSPVLGVDHVRVAGGEHTGLRDIERATGLHRGQAMVDLDEAGLARRAMALPWVLTAKVSRHWPRTVVVTITERAPVAAIPGAGGGWAVVDRTGRVLANLLVPPSDRPTLAGLPSAGGAGTILPAVARPSLVTAVALSPSLLRAVASIAPDGASDAQPGDVALQLRSGAFVRLGSIDRLPEKMNAVATVLAQVDLTNLVALDVRVPESPTIRRS